MKTHRLTERLFHLWRAIFCMCLLLISGCEYAYNGPGYSIVEENPNTEPWFNVYRPANMNEVIEDTGRLLPVIVWANGGCFRSDFTWQPLFKRWAAEGYVVLALSENPGGGALSSTTVEHHGALIDWAVNQSSYVDMLDINKIVAAGNSCGGVTALGLAAEDERVAMVFVLSGSSAIASTSEAIMGNITVPVGYVIGSDTDVAGGPARGDYEALDQSIPAMIVSRSEGGHFTVSTTVSILEDVADISFHWMNLVLFGSADSYEVLTSENVCSDCAEGDWTLTSRHLASLLE